MEESKLYELGYLLSPLIAEEQLGEMLEKNIKQAVTAVGGVVKSEHPPRSITLAYPIRKTAEHKTSVFHNAFFGTIVFEAVPGQVKNLLPTPGKSALVIRSLLVNYPEQLTRPAPRRAPRVEAPAPDITVEPAAAPEIIKREKMTTEAIDREIESLLTPV